eukprot:TRINITY_DN55580_c0_g1_i1.p1 TRINITY_DN55580_c0_g1~~TRINITY_DN55580_c0_g1_i1.p1  ORF type:complete len:584 (+),score=237.39 TRINITY_DN55580_c0_g1_i1:101-1753(+)
MGLRAAPLVLLAAGCAAQTTTATTSTQLNLNLCRQLLERNMSGSLILQQLFENQQRQNSALYGAAVVTLLPGLSAPSEVSWRTSGAFGLSSLSSPTRAFSLDTPTRIGSVSELMVVAAALTMTNTIANNLDQPVNPQYMPNSLPLKNPSYSTQDITYRMLMQHTSSLADTGYANYIRRPSCSASGECGGESAETFRTFVEQTFAPVTLGSQTLDPKIFGSQMPGADASYRFAHVNTALLAYIMDRIIQDGAETVQSVDKSVGSYIEERILHPLGMGSTFYLSNQGQVPVLANQRLSQYENMKAREYDSTGTADARFVHSNYPGDVMQFSSALDIGSRLAAVLLAPASTGTTDCEPAALCAVGKRMRDTAITVSANAREFQTKQGLGVVYYDPERICAETIASGMFSKCPLKAEHQVWGYVSAASATDRTSVAGVYCTDASGGSTVRSSCVTVLQAVKYTAVGQTSARANFAMAGAAFQTAFGESERAIITGADDDDDLYGLWVFFGVIGTIGFVLVASYFTEFLVQPASANPPVVKRQGVQDPAAVPTGM